MRVMWKRRRCGEEPKRGQWFALVPSKLSSQRTSCSHSRDGHQWLRACSALMSM